MIVMFREFLVSGFRLVAAGKGEVIAASNWGKLKTVTQMVALILFFADNYGFGYFINHTIDNTVSFILNVIVTVLLIISVIATIISGWDYISNGKNMLKD